MFTAVSRSVTRRTVPNSIRCMAKQSTPRPPRSAENSSAKPNAEKATNASASASSKHTESSSLEKFEEPKPEPKPELKPEIPIITRSSVPSLDFSPPDPSASGENQRQQERTGASSRDSLSSADRQRQMFGRVTVGLIVLAFGLGAFNMGREWSEEELRDRKMTLANAPATRWDRTKDRFSELFDYFSKPAWSELLPPPYPPPHQKPYTLLISIDDLLVTSTWDRQHGWRTAKRPGVDYFLAYISQFYEVVVFTTQHAYTAAPILDKLDRYNFFITHRLYREATRSYKGQVVKDLSYLNRDLSKVILLDTEASHAATHPENAIIVPKWNGDPKDNGLVALIPFLESIAIYKPADVRPILSAYEGKDIPIEYAKREAEGKRQHIENWKLNKGSTSNTFGSFFGVSSRSTNNAPPTYLEQKRKEAQMQYQEEQTYIAKNKDYLEKLLKQDQDMMAAQVPSNIWEAIDQLRGVGSDEGKGKSLEGQDKLEEVGGGSGSGSGSGSEAAAKP